MSASSKLKYFTESRLAKVSGPITRLVSLFTNLPTDEFEM